MRVWHFAAVVALIGASAAASGGEDHAVMLSFDTMYGVDGPFLGEASPIRGLDGDSLPWTIGRAKGRLTVDGHLTIQLRGLVFSDDPSVPPELRGKNDEDAFRGVVSCLSESEDGTHVVRHNVFSPPFPASTDGDAMIDAHLRMPDSCVAPVVFIVAGDEDYWFAATGAETE